jgi:hypothetical protein
MFEMVPQNAGLVLQSVSKNVRLFNHDFSSPTTLPALHFPKKSSFMIKIQTHFFAANRAQILTSLLRAELRVYTVGPAYRGLSFFTSRYGAIKEESAAATVSTRRASVINPTFDASNFSRLPCFTSI